MGGTNTGALVAYTSSKASTTVGVLAVSISAVAATEITAVASAVLAGSVSCLGLAAFSSTAAALLVGDSGATNVYTATLLITGGNTLSVTHAAAATSVTKTPFDIGGVLDPATGAIQVLVAPVLTAGLQAWTKFQLSSANVSSSKSTPFSMLQLTIPSGTGRINFPHSKPFALGSSVYVAVVALLQLQSLVTVLDMSGNVVATALYGNSNTDVGPLLLGMMVQPSVSGTTVSIPVRKQGTLSFTWGISTTPVGVSRLRLTLGRTGTVSC